MGILIYGMTTPQLIRLPLNFHAHKALQSGGGLIKLPQGGAGLGNLFRSFFRWIAPIGKSVIKQGVQAGKKIAKTQLVKDAAKTLQSDLTNAGVDMAQTALQGGNIKESFQNQTKKIGTNLSNSVSDSLEKYRPEDKDKEKNKLARKTKRGNTKPFSSSKRKKLIGGRIRDNLG